MPRRREVHPVPHDPDYKTSVVRSPKQALLSLESSLTEETGPVFGHDLLGPLDNNLICNHPARRPGGGREDQGSRPRSGRNGPTRAPHVGRGLAGQCRRAVSACEGYLFRPLDPNFGGCGRTIADEDGSYEFMTIRPGAYPWPNRANDWRPMHIHFSIFGSGFGQRLISQMYFQGDPLIDLCPIAHMVKDRGQLDRLVAPLDMQNSRAMDCVAYKFDIVLRGRRQTMFENKPEGM